MSINGLRILIVRNTATIFLGITFVLLLTSFSNSIQYGQGQPQPVQKDFKVVIKMGSSVPGYQSLIKASYDPDTLPTNVSDAGIPINSTVTWINDDESFHTVTSGNITKGPDGKFNSGILPPKVSWTWTFSNPGKFEYYCTVHPYMDGYVTVAKPNQVSEH
jgi:hypothetical protein